MLFNDKGVSLLEFNKITLIALCSFSSHLYAQLASDDASTWKIKLGAGMMANSHVWKDINSQVTLIPYLEVSRGNWLFDVENPVTYRLNVNSYASLYMGIGIRSDYYEPGDVEITQDQDSAVFNGYKKPHSETVVNYGASFGLLSVDANTDVSSNSNADTLALIIEIPIYEGLTGFSLATSLSANWMDAHYVNYYYGISGNQVDNSIGRTQYHTGSAINYDLVIQAMYPLNEQWVLLGKFEHTQLADEIIDSPLVDSHHQAFLGFLAIYQF